MSRTFTSSHRIRIPAPPRLVVTLDGQPLAPGSQVKDFRGDARTFEGATRPPLPGKSAKIQLDGAEYYASVVPGLAVMEPGQ